MVSLFPSPNLKSFLSTAAKVNLLKCTSDGVITLLKILRWLSSQSKAKVLTTTDHLLHSPLCPSFPALPLILPAQPDGLWAVPGTSCGHTPDQVLRFGLGRGLALHFLQVSLLKCHFSVELFLATLGKLPSRSPFRFSLSIYHNVAYLVFYFFIVFLPIKI